MLTVVMGLANVSAFASAGGGAVHQFSCQTTRVVEEAFKAPTVLEFQVSGIEAGRPEFLVKHDDGQPVTSVPKKSALTHFSNPSLSVAKGSLKVKAEKEGCQRIEMVINISRLGSTDSTGGYILSTDLGCEALTAYAQLRCTVKRVSGR